MADQPQIEMWDHYLARHRPTPFDIFFSGIVCGAFLGSALMAFVLTLLKFMAGSEPF